MPAPIKKAAKAAFSLKAILMLPTIRMSASLHTRVGQSKHGTVRVVRLHTGRGRGQSISRGGTAGESNGLIALTLGPRVRHGSHACCSGVSIILGEAPL